MKKYYVYIASNKINSVLYIGVTNNLSRRIAEHQLGLVKGFTSKYNVKYLLFFEAYNNVYDAIAREKRIKKWKREWKFNLIKESNPEMKDLSYNLPY